MSRHQQSFVGIVKKHECCLERSFLHFFSISICFCSALTLKYQGITRHSIRFSSFFICSHLLSHIALDGIFPNRPMSVAGGRVPPLSCASRDVVPFEEASFWLPPVYQISAKARFLIALSCLPSTGSQFTH